jgi:hypothetical protein
LAYGGPDFQTAELLRDYDVGGLILSESGGVGLPDLLGSNRGRSVLFVLALLPVLGAVFGVAVSGRFASNELLQVALLIFGGIGWLSAVSLAGRGAGDLRIVVAGALALRILAWSGNAGWSDDAYRYLWEGELVIEGVSPYGAAPDEASDRNPSTPADLRHAYPELWSRVNHKEVPAAYPPLAQFVGAAIAKVCRWCGAAPETTGIRILRLLFGACDLLVLWPLVELLDRARLPRELGVVWGWCPLPAIEFAGAGHLDSLGILLLLGALASHRPRAGSRETDAIGAVRRFVPLALLSAGILVKYLPLVALPWLLRGRNAIRGVVIVLLLCAVAFVPFAFMEGAPSRIFSGLGEYAFRWDTGSLVHRWIEPLFDPFFPRDERWSDPRRLARGLEAIAWLAIAWRVIRRQPEAILGAGDLLGAWLVLSPTLHPWYLCWILPFVAFGPTFRSHRAWQWLILVAPVLYWPLETWQRIGVWSEPAWLWPVVALPFFMLLLAAHRRRGD